mmetsp:Transcript_5557/g.17788  ORF Transcript_5557/g.17788 Transcript_5557/m.17788 type:complete len:357 (-) Transcript_5557:357-1427(-)|eukprot:CAMPEP_0202088538 /NCGR_PEP_ID=MMETSP0964-20121228/38788_1 /ASSEMBLY_ACC=CAM_ASM_000500 /TAXON_ID=4773 /ORGANISM="Schizochytrium aggregatum, Strain ATCC28209" /LENGTH=356 /DNA_ID=CAMNT_0048656563 /DNA_START=13 /DNA_END=1083 /DNA_ORIENTATION=-
MSAGTSTALLQQERYATAARARALLRSTLAAMPCGAALAALVNDEHDFTCGPASDARGRRALRAAVPQDALHLGWARSQFFFNKDGLAIFWRRWLPPPERRDPPRAIVIISHGLGEHCGRYEHLATTLAAHGFAVYALDHQGHGQSEGSRLFARFFTDFCQDLLALTARARKSHPAVTKTFMLGHSMGGLIAIHTVNTAPRLFTGVVICSPALKVDVPPLADKVAPLVATFLPKFPAPGLDLRTLCRDHDVIDRYMNDPLVCKGKATLRLANEIVLACQAAHIDVAPVFATPYLLIHGTGDRICLPEGSEAFHAATPAQDKTFTTFPGHFHELLNEPDRDQHAIAAVLSWLQKRAD